MSTSKKEYLIVIVGNGKPHSFKIMGEPVTIPGYEELDAFIHRDPVMYSFFAVSDALTGTRIGISRGNKQAAIEDARKQLAKSSMVRIRKQQKKFIRQVGKLDKLPPKEALP